MTDVPPRAAVPAHRTLRGLIIEDEPVIAADIEATLAGAGYSTVAIAATRSEALEHFIRHRPDFVTADLQLADGSSGLDAVRDVLTIEKVPVLFVTAFPERLLTKDRPEPTFLITKPFWPETLVAAIDKALETSEHSSVPLRGLRGAASDALASLLSLAPASEILGQNLGAGHNRGASNSPLGRAEYDILTNSLGQLATIGAGTTLPTRANAAEIERQLELASDKITGWVSERLSQIQEGFFTQLGASLADWKALLAAWVICSGKLDNLVAILQQLPFSG